MVRPVGTSLPALGLFLGSATGLSAAVIPKLTEQWKAEQRAFAERDLMDYVYPGGGRHPRQYPPRGAEVVPAGDDRLSADGRKELVALVRGMRAPATRRRPRGFWGALREVFPETRE
jgi:hypothetical protein